MSCIFLEEFSTIVDFLFCGLEVHFAVCEVFPEILEFLSQIILLVNLGLELVCEIGELLFELNVFPGGFLMFIDSVFELGDLIFQFDVLIVQAISLIR